MANVDEATLFVLFAASHGAAYATGPEFVADSGYLLVPVDAPSGPPLHHAAVVILPAALRRTHLPASPAPGSTSDNALGREAKVDLRLDVGPAFPTTTEIVVTSSVTRPER